MSYREESKKILKKKGYKITRPREMVLDVLEESKEPLSPYEMSDLIKSKGETGDVVGIYRSLEILEELGLVHKVISLGKYSKCHLELNEDKHDHHNLICKNCGKIQEVHCLGLDLLERVVSSEYNFKVEYHALEFYGLCADCSSKKI